MDIFSLFWNVVFLVYFFLLILINLGNPILSWFSHMFWSIKCCFKCIRILNAKLLEQNNSRCSLFLFLNCHFAFFCTKNGAVALNIFRYAPDNLIWNSYLLLISEVFTSIHKHIHISTMTVHIAWEYYSSTIWILLVSQLVIKFNERLCIINCWM